MRLLLLLSFLGVLPGVCLAQAYIGSGEWCLVLDETEQCAFKAAADCYDAAYSKGGYCRQNERKSRVSGATPWCVVSAAGRDCSYYSQQTCMNAAMANQGGCVPNTEKALESSQAFNKYMGLYDPTEDVDDSQSLAESLQEAQKAQEELMQGAQQ